MGKEATPAISKLGCLYLLSGVWERKVMIIGSLYRVGGRSLDGLRDIKIPKDETHAPHSRFSLFQSPIVNFTTL